MSNLTGAPAVTLPAGLDGRGLPVGIQVICRRFADDLCLLLAGRVAELLPAPGSPPGYLA
jgi:Asp-tRNA(Asn)/Glu-tRNA(Gln) amidotransferase A subunit family amidase